MALAEQILTAYDGREGLTKVKAYCLDGQTAKGDCPDLILLDINMPIMDGFEVIEQQQQIGRKDLVETNVIVLTSSSSPKDKNKMLRYGVTKYIEKPLSPD